MALLLDTILMEVHRVAIDLDEIHQCPFQNYSRRSANKPGISTYRNIHLYEALTVKAV